MTIAERIEQKTDELRESYKDASLDEIYADARDNHIWALGSSTSEEAAEFAITACALILIAGERGEK